MSERPAYQQALAEFICGARLSDLSPVARDHARWVVADCVPVIAAGMQVPEMKAWSAAHLAPTTVGSASVIGTGRRAHPRDAALLNGAAGTWLELDEGNLPAKGHPGIQVVPASLAIAQEAGASGEEVLLASALGYEVCSRISRAANLPLTIHPHGTWGVVGAAVAAARLKRFKRAQLLELLNVAPSMAMATSRNTLLEGSTVRNIYTGHSGYMGIVATELVEAGFTGEVDGLASTYGRVLSERFDSRQVVEGLGRDWMIAGGYFKLHPTGRYVHAAIDALEQTLASMPGKRVDAAAITRIDVRTYKLAAMLDGKRVTSSFGARFSIPFALASIIVRGTSGLESFSDAAVTDPRIRALCARVNVVERPAYTAAYPAKQPCDVGIVLHDGRVLEGHCEVMKGEPANPHTDAELETKFVDLGRPVWGEEVTRAVFDGLMRLERLPDFRRFAERYNV